jgi:Mg-chelatase subunit ChlD
MEAKHQVHNLIILDESGSMESIKSSIIQGFNEVVQTIKGIEREYPEQEHYISFIAFNGLGQKIHRFIDKASQLSQIDEKSYQPDANTPLYDAMGYSLNKLKQALQGQKDYNVLVTVLTDGEENASKEFSGKDIKKMIQALQEERWTFTYIGADHDVEKAASSISITNTMSFEKNEANIKAMFAKDRNARANYSKKIRLKENTASNFFDNIEDDKKRNKGKSRLNSPNALKGFAMLQEVQK